MPSSFRRSRRLSNTFVKEEKIFNANLAKYKYNSLIRRFNEKWTYYNLYGSEIPEEEDIAEKSKINYQLDEYGFLPQYRVKLLNTSKRVIPTELIYVGNFANSICPQKEFIPHSKENIVSVAWKQFDETFETKMIKRYCGHNLRELSIYKDKNI